MTQNWLELWSKRFENPLDDAETFKINEGGYLLEIGQKPKKHGFIKVFIFQCSEKFYKKISMTDFLSTDHKKWNS